MRQRQCGVDDELEEACAERTHLSGVALEAVLAVLAGAVLADLAVGDGGVAVIVTLAAVVDWRIDDEPGRPAEERLGAAALEQADAGRSKLRRAGCDAVAVQ